MSGEAEYSSLIQLIFDFEDKSNSSVQKEIRILRKILELYGSRSFDELSSVIQRLQGIIASLPEPFEERVKLFIEGSPLRSGKKDTVETLTKDFKKLVKADVTALAKKFDVNLSSKNEYQEFEHWLSTGEKPLSTQERLLKQVNVYANEVLQLKDATFEQLSSETIERIVAIAETVKKGYKIDGLKVFMQAIGIPPVGSTGIKLIAQIRGAFSEISINRLKMKQIREQN